MGAIYVVYNPKSGGNDRHRELKAACKKAGLETIFIAISDWESKFNEINKTKSATVVAAGGDGTVSAVAGKLAGTDLCMGVIPVGTLNHFAKDLQIPLDIESAAAVIAAGKTVQIDTAKVNEEVFVNNSSIGVYPDIVRTRDKHAPAVGKWPAAFYGLFVQLRAPRAYKFEIMVDNKKLTVRSPFIFVGNNSYNVDKAGINNRTTLAGGELCLYVIKSESRLHLLSLAILAVMGRAEAQKGFESLAAKKINIKTYSRRTIEVAFDGEVKRINLPLNYSIQSRSLNVIVPQNK